MQLSALNVECLVCLGHQPRPIVSLPFVHTARRCYRWWLDRVIRRSDHCSQWYPAEIGQCPAARGSKSRNKVAVGEPAAGSLQFPRGSQQGASKAETYAEDQGMVVTLAWVWGVSLWGPFLPGVVESQKLHWRSVSAKVPWVHTQKKGVYLPPVILVVVASTVSGTKRGETKANRQSPGDVASLIV